MVISNGVQAPVFETEDQHGNAVKVPGDKKAVLMFMRYLGCPLCLQKIKGVAANIERFRAAGAEVMVVVQSTPGRVKIFAEKNGLPFTLISDRENKLYELYDVSVGGIRQFLAPNVLKESAKAMLKGHLHGRFEGKEFQIPAAFVIGTDGKVQLAHYGKDVADFGDMEDILEALKGAP